MSPRSAILQSKVMKTLISQQNFNNFNKNLNISVESWPICTKPSEQGSFFWGSQYESKECYAMIKTDENLNISAESWLIWQILPKRWLRLAPNGQFWSFCKFFHLFPQNEAQIDSEWPISPIHNFSHLLPPKHLIFGEISKIFIPRGGVHQQMFSVFQLFQIISHQSGSKWPIMANFATKVAWMSSKWAILVKFQQKLKYLSRILTDLQNRAHFSEPVKMSPRSAMLWSKLINTLISQQNHDRSAPNLQNKVPNWSKWVQGFFKLMAKFSSKILIETGQNESKECCGSCRFFHLFPQNEDWLGMANFTWFTTFPIFLPPKWRNLKNFHSMGEYISKFFEFFNFFKSFHTKAAQNDPQWQFCHQSGLDELKMGKLNFNKT